MYTLSEKPNLISLTELAAELEKMFLGLKPRAPLTYDSSAALSKPKKDVSDINTGPS